MRAKIPKVIEKCRVTTGVMKSDKSMGFNGAFIIRHLSAHLTVIISDEALWDHVSVSLPSRTPTWGEMNFIKGMFFDNEETVIQFHPPRSQYINNHAFCLHLWRDQSREIVLPPQFMVGIKGCED